MRCSASHRRDELKLYDGPPRLPTMVDGILHSFPNISQREKPLQIFTGAVHKYIGLGAEPNV